MMELAPTTREIIYASDHLKVVYRPGPGDTVIVTFSSFGFRAVGDDFWGASLVDRVDMPALGFVSMRPNWFPPADLHAALPIALAKLGGRRVVTYGHSQGAYGALKYGKSLNAKFALAFSPQWSINPAEVKSFDHRYHSYYDQSLRNGEAIEQDDLCERNFIIVDRADKIDLAHATILSAMRNVTLVPAPFTGHGTVILIAEGSQGRPLLHLCMQPDEIKAQNLRQLIKAARRKSPSYQRTKIEQLQKILPRHQLFYNAALDTMAEGAEKTIAYLLGHLGAGQLDEAANALAHLSDDALATLSLLRLWPIFRASGFDVGERRIAPLFKRAHQDSVFARLHGVGSMIKFGQNDEALRELNVLVGMPDAEGCTRFFLEHYGRLGRLDLASAFLDLLFKTGRLNRAERLRLGLQIAATLRAHKKPAEAARELIVLQGLCKGDVENLVMLTDVALEGGAFGLARDLLASIAGLPNAPPLHLVHKVQLEAQTDLRTARAQLAALVQMACDDLAFWQKLTDTGERMGEAKIALKAAEKAFAVSGKSFDARKRLVSVMVANGERRAALRHLKALETDPQSATAIAGRLADQAVICGDDGLALRFAALWVEAAPADLESHILFCRMLANRGDLRGAATAIDKFAVLVEQGVRPNREQFINALDAARRVGNAAEGRVAKLALAEYPGDQAFSVFTTPGGSLFSQGPSLAPAPQPQRRPLESLLASLGFGRRT